MFTNIHTHNSPSGIELYIFSEHIENFAAIPAHFISIGIHPWYIKTELLQEQYAQLKEFSFHKNVLAIGECGLDRLVETPMKLQEEVFIEQIKIAESVQKPLIIHCVKAFDDLIRIKKEQKISVPLIIHGYKNNKQIAKELIKNDCMLSFGKALTDERTGAGHILKMLEPEQFFLENDNSDLPIKTIFEKAAELRRMDVEVLKEKMMLNFKRIFKYE